MDLSNGRILKKRINQQQKRSEASKLSAEELTIINNERAPSITTKITVIYIG